MDKATAIHYALRAIEYRISELYKYKEADPSTAWKTVYRNEIDQNREAVEVLRKEQFN